MAPMCGGGRVVAFDGADDHVGDEAVDVGFVGDVFQAFDIVGVAGVG